MFFLLLAWITAICQSNALRVSLEQDTHVTDPIQLVHVEADCIPKSSSHESTSLTFGIYASSTMDHIDFFVPGMAEGSSCEVVVKTIDDQKVFGPSLVIQDEHPIDEIQDRGDFEYEKQLTAIVSFYRVIGVLLDVRRGLDINTDIDLFDDSISMSLRKIFTDRVKRSGNGLLRHISEQMDGYYVNSLNMAISNVERMWDWLVGKVPVPWNMKNLCRGFAHAELSNKLLFYTHEYPHIQNENIDKLREHTSDIMASRVSVIKRESDSGKTTEIIPKLPIRWENKAYYKPQPLTGRVAIYKRDFKDIVNKENLDAIFSLLSSVPMVYLAVGSILFTRVIGWSSKLFTMLLFVFVLIPLIMRGDFPCCNEQLDLIRNAPAVQELIKVQPQLAKYLQVIIHEIGNIMIVLGKVLKAL